MTDNEIEDIKNRLIKEVDNEDAESAHESADNILCELLIKLGHESIVEIYQQVEKWYS